MTGYAHAARFALGLLLGTLGCSPSSTGDTGCKPGDTRACVGPGACQGGQVCLSDGTGYAACDCGSGATGGAPGSGGTSGVGGVAGSTGSGAAGVGGGSGGTAGAPQCPAGTKGAALVLVETAAGEPYCVDSTETSSADYQQFLTEVSPATGQPPECTANTTFEPLSIYQEQCHYSVHRFDPVAYPTRPVNCVDWCDAHAYCKWAGKRLCGKVGGGALSPTARADATQSEWFNACSMQGTKTYPYGDTFDYKECAIGGSFPAAISTDRCEGGFPGVFDMTGNVAEWEDSCDGNTGLDDACVTRGGTWWFLGNAAQCTAPSVSLTRGDPQGGMGIRCCADVEWTGGE